MPSLYLTYLPNTPWIETLRCIRRMMLRTVEKTLSLVYQIQNLNRARCPFTLNQTPSLSSKFWHFPHKPLAFLNIFALQSRKSIKFMFMKCIGSFCIKGDTLHVIVRLVYRLFCCLPKVWMKVASKSFLVLISFFSPLFFILACHFEFWLQSLLITIVFGWCLVPKSGNGR